jgi:hypothetical protein
MLGAPVDPMRRGGSGSVLDIAAAFLRVGFHLVLLSAVTARRGVQIARRALCDQPCSHHAHDPARDRAAGSGSISVADGDAASPVPLRYPGMTAVGMLHTTFDEDRIYAETIGGLWPLVIVADGIGVIERRDTAHSLVGHGEEAASHAVTLARNILGTGLPQAQTVEDVLQILRDVYAGVVTSFAEVDIVGATTLLVALLWHSDGGDTRYWCYAYIGDGYITLLARSRPVDGIVLPEWLLSPQRVERTAGLRRTGAAVPPVVGCRRYEPGDVLYLASDGLVPVDRWLRETHGATFAYYLLSHVNEPDQLLDVLAECPSYDDDVVLGIIWTEEPHDRPGRADSGGSAQDHGGTPQGRTRNGIPD